jgi:phage tail-like protein
VSVFFDEPLKTFRFLVEVEGEGNKIVAAFSRFSGVKMKVDTVMYRPGSEIRGVADGIPALTSFENVTLTKGVIGDNEFLEWIQAVAPGTTEAPTGKDISRTISVVALDDKGRRAVTWFLLDAIPVVYELGEMDSTNSAVLSETIEFSIGGFRRETSLTPA